MSGIMSSRRSSICRSCRLLDHEGTEDTKREVDVQKAAFEEEGVAVNSPWIEGLPTAEAKAKITGMLEEKGIGKKRVNYKYGIGCSAGSGTGGSRSRLCIWRMDDGPPGG